MLPRYLLCEYVKSEANRYQLEWSKNQGIAMCNVLMKIDQCLAIQLPLNFSLLFFI